MRAVVLAASLRLHVDCIPARSLQTPCFCLARLHSLCPSLHVADACASPASACCPSCAVIHVLCLSSLGCSFCALCAYIRACYLSRCDVCLLYLFSCACSALSTLYSALRSLLHSALFTPLCTLYSQLRSAFRTLYSAVDSALYLPCMLFILECCMFYCDASTYLL